MSENSTLIQQTVQALSFTISGDPGKLAEGEKALNELSLKDNFIPACMLIVGDESCHEHLRISAIVAMKNQVTLRWRPSNSHPLLSDEDKKVLKDNILEAIIRCASYKRLYSQYEDILTKIFHTEEFPKGWPDFMDRLITRTKDSSNFQEIMGCLICLKMVFRHFQYLVGEDRKPLEDLVDHVFPLLEGAAEKLILNFDESAALILRVIIKTFFISNHLGVPQYLRNPDNLKKWMIILKALWDKPIPPELEVKTSSSDEAYKRGKHILWRVRNLVARSVFLFAQRTANYLDTKRKKKEEKGFYEYWLTTHSNDFLESALTQFLKKNTCFIASKSMYYLWKYLFYSLRMQTTLPNIIPHLETLMIDYALPSIFFNEDDNQVWKEDPAEYIRREEDFTYIGLACRAAALDFIGEAAKKENTATNESFLFIFVKFCGHCLLEGKDPRNGNSIDPIMKEAVIWSLNTLDMHILPDQTIKSRLELLMERAIIPELSSQYGFLRARACEFFKCFGTIKFEKNSNVSAALDGICKCLVEQDLPVSVKACLALTTLLQHDAAKEILRPNLADALKVFLKLMDTIDNEQILKGLEGLIESFRDEIAPFAFDLVDKLTSGFMKVTKNPADIEDDDDDGDGAMAAAGCVNAIWRIMRSTLPPSLYPKLETMLHPIFEFAFSPDGVDYMEEVSDVCLVLVYNLEQLSEHTWTFFVKLLHAIGGHPTILSQPGADLSKLTEDERLILEQEEEGWASENILHLIGVFENFITKGRSLNFLGAKDEYGNTYIDLILKAIDRVISIGLNGADDLDMIGVLRLYICLLENYGNGQLNTLLPVIIDRCMELLDVPKRSKGFKVICIEVIAICLWYNPSLTLQHLVSKNGLVHYFETWYGNLKYFKASFDKQRMLLGLASLFTLHSTELPQAILAVSSNIMREVYKLTGEILELQNEDDEYDDDDETDAKGKTEEEEFDEEEAIEGTVKKIKALNQKMMKDDYADDLDLEGEDKDYDNEKDIAKMKTILYDSPLDEIDEIVYLRDCLQGLMQRDPNFYQNLVSVLTSDEQNDLAKNFDTAYVQHQAFLARKAEDEAKEKMMG